MNYIINIENNKIENNSFPYCVFRGEGGSQERVCPKKGRGKGNTMPAKHDKKGKEEEEIDVEGGVKEEEVKKEEKKKLKAKSYKKGATARKGGKVSPKARSTRGKKNVASGKVTKPRTTGRVSTRRSKSGAVKSHHIGTGVKRGRGRPVASRHKVAAQ